MRVKPQDPAQAQDQEKKPRTAKQLANDERLRQRAAERRSVPPVSIPKTYETGDKVIGQDGVREFDKDGELPQPNVASALDIRGTKRRDGTFRGEQWMQDMAHANEMVEVVILESTDKLAHPFPEVWVNGRVQRFVRGEKMKVRRCYVEKLARMKLTTYDSVKTKDVDGEDVYRYPSHTGLVYPFSLVNPTPQDTEWLNRILREA